MVGVDIERLSVPTVLVEILNIRSSAAGAQLANLGERQFKLFMRQLVDQCTKATIHGRGALLADLGRQKKNDIASAPGNAWTML